MGDERLKCGCIRPLDFGRPTQREAVCLTRASLLVALVFWVIILVATCQGEASGKSACWLVFTPSRPERQCGQLDTVLFSCASQETSFKSASSRC